MPFQWKSQRKHPPTDSATTVPSPSVCAGQIGPVPVARRRAAGKVLCCTRRETVHASEPPLAMGAYGRAASRGRRRRRSRAEAVDARRGAESRGEAAGRKSHRRRRTDESRGVSEASRVSMPHISGFLLAVSTLHLRRSSAVQWCRAPTVAAFHQPPSEGGFALDAATALALSQSTPPGNLSWGQVGGRITARIPRVAAHPAIIPGRSYSPRQTQSPGVCFSECRACSPPGRFRVRLSGHFQTSG